MIFEGHRGRGGGVIIGKTLSGLVVGHFGVVNSQGSFCGAKC